MTTSNSDFRPVDLDNPTTKKELVIDVIAAIAKYDENIRSIKAGKSSDHEEEPCSVCRFYYDDENQVSVPACGNCPNRPPYNNLDDLEEGEVDEYTCSEWPSAYPIYVAYSDGKYDENAQIKALKARRDFLIAFLPVLMAMPNDASHDDIRLAQLRLHEQMAYSLDGLWKPKNYPTIEQQVADGSRFIEVTRETYDGEIPRGYDLVIVEEGDSEFRTAVFMNRKVKKIEIDTHEGYDYFVGPTLYGFLKM